MHTDARLRRRHHPQRLLRTPDNHQYFRMNVFCYVDGVGVADAFCQRLRLSDPTQGRLEVTGFYSILGHIPIEVGLPEGIVREVQTATQVLHLSTWASRPQMGSQRMYGSMGRAKPPALRRILSYQQVQRPIAISLNFQSATCTFQKLGMGSECAGQNAPRRLTLGRLRP